MIKIDEDFSIIADDNCYIVCKFSYKDKNGEDVYKNLTYHRTLKEALTALIRKKQIKLVAENELTLQQAINEFKRIEEEFEQALKENIKEGEEQKQIQS